MSRLGMLLAVIVVAGCVQPSAEPTRPRPSAPKAVTAEGEIDFANWASVKSAPVPVPRSAPVLCDINSKGAVGFSPQRQDDHGPHDKPAIVVRVNPVGFEAFRDRKSPLPVGTVIVKEKHESIDAKGPPKEYGAMVKREPGYDPTRGDWEYVYVVREPTKTVTRGQLESCIYCHVRQMNEDYVFRTYLK